MKSSTSELGLSGFKIELNIILLYVGYFSLWVIIFM